MELPAKEKKDVIVF
jgi:hypothetical protein